MYYWIPQSNLSTIDFNTSSRCHVRDKMRRSYVYDLRRTAAISELKFAYDLPTSLEALLFVC
jgi:hypothetical protein